MASEINVLSLILFLYSTAFAFNQHVEILEYSTVLSHFLSTFINDLIGWEIISSGKESKGIDRGTRKVAENKPGTTGLNDDYHYFWWWWQGFRTVFLQSDWLMQTRLQIFGLTSFFVIINLFAQCGLFCTQCHLFNVKLREFLSSNCLLFIIIIIKRKNTKL